MSAAGFDAAQAAMADFNENDRKELQQFLENEEQKAKFQQNVHNLTAMCWTKCIAANRISGPTPDSAEQTCLQNCVNRFLDTQKSVITLLEQSQR